LAEASASNGAPSRYEKKQEEIIRIAARVFAEKGYHATSIDDLVAATGLQRGGLYHYIGSKKDLLILIHERSVEPLLDEFRKIRASGERPNVALRMLARVLLENVERHRDEVTVFLHEWRAMKEDPRWGGIRNIRKEFEDIVVELLERGCDEGLFSISDTRVAMYTFLGMLNYTYQWFDPGGRVNAGELAEQMCDIFLEGIETR
jgi:AcrR family transcriptional regulator